MEQKPTLTISGYRGIWDKDLNEQITFEFALAYAKIIKKNGGKKILVGRDARKSGPLMLHAVKSAMEKEGIKVDNAGIIPTPSILLLVKKLSYDGGIIITASHNPIEYNGLKFVMSNGLFATSSLIKEINENKENLNDIYIKNQNTNNEQENNDEFKKIHIEEVLKNIDKNIIKNKKYKVTLDPINSAGSLIIQEFLGNLECDVNIINGEQSGEFAHEPEPLTKNLNQLSEAVIKNGSHVGFAVDPDADRLIIVNERGEILSEEYTLALALKNVLSANPSDVVVNISTSKMCENITNFYGKKIFKTKIGELNVVDKMIEINSNIGGEGNGGVIYPKVHYCRDSLSGIGLILELMAKENKQISEIANELPKYIMRKDKIAFSGELNEFYRKMKNEFCDAFIDTKDGVRFDWPDFSWIHIRPSNTEPVVRIIGEAKTENKINYLFEKVRSLV